MEILPEPKDIKNKLLEFLKELMGEDGLTFLELDNAIAAVKQGQPVWQPPFAIGLHTLPFLYHWERDSQGTAVPDLALLVWELASQTDPKGKTVTDLVGLALEPLEARYSSLSAEIPGYGLTDEETHTLFHTRLALGVLLLVKGDEERATTRLREMAATKTTRRGPTFSSEGLNHWDVEVTKALAAIVLQDFYARRQDYELALYLLTEAVASNSPGPFSERLLAVVPGLLESFAEKCERVNNFNEWVDLFDRAAGITEICGEADTSGDLPANCKVDSPQFLAWKFGQLVAHFAIQNSPSLGDSKHLLTLLPWDYQSDGTVVSPVIWECGDGWGNGTAVASLLCEYDEHRNWQILRQQYVSMWESSSRYQWLSLCEAGTWTDLYWAIRIGFADQILSTKEQIPTIQLQSEPSAIIRDIETTEEIVSTIALRQLKQQFNSDKMLEFLQKLYERQPPSKQEILAFLEQQLCSVWDKLPPDVQDALVEAEQGFRNEAPKRHTVLDFHYAVNACLRCYFVNPLVIHMEKEVKEMLLRVGEKWKARPIRIGVDTAGKSASTHPNRLSLSIWASLFEELALPGTKSATNLPIEVFVRQNWPKVDTGALKRLGESLRIVQENRNCAAHPRFRPRMEEKKELEQTRNLVLGINEPSVITQIFQLFTGS